MDRYDGLKAVAGGLKACSQAVPFPGGLALESAARLVLVVTAFMELKKVKERERQQAERLLQRAVDISNLIERHQRELRRDQACSAFILRFLDSMKVIHAFVDDLMPQKGAAKKQSSLQELLLTVTMGIGKTLSGGGQESERVFEEHWRNLDSLLLDFQSYLLSNQASMGPHQLIKHPDVQIFWKCRLTNALEAPWEYFWDHFLDEYLQLKEIFCEEEGQKMREIFQNLAHVRNKDFVDPMELNKIFQPIDEPVEKIVLAQLKKHLSKDSALELMALLDPGANAAAQGELQQWTGYWLQGSHKGSMELEIFITNDHQVLGSGVDEVGKFTIEGEDLAANVNWTKHYVGEHIVNYEGSKVGHTSMQGFWSLCFDAGNWSRGDFHLERKNVEEAHWQWRQSPCRLQSWTGFYKQFGMEYGMSTCFVFTPTGKIHGKGVDDIGHYTWFGTFHEQDGGKEVALIKQYFQAHSILYNGQLKESTNGKLAMKGTWTTSHHCNGVFELQSID